MRNDISYTLQWNKQLNYSLYIYVFYIANLQEYHNAASYASANKTSVVIKNKQWWWQSYTILQHCQWNESVSEINRIVKCYLIHNISIVTTNILWAHTSLCD